MSDASLHKPKFSFGFLITRRGWGSRLPGFASGFIFATPALEAANAADPQARPYQATNDNHCTNSPTPGPLVA